MAEPSVKDEARRIVEQLPEDATWEQLADIVSMHERVARARRDSAAAKGISSEELLKRIGRYD